MLVKQLPIPVNTRALKGSLGFAPDQPVAVRAAGLTILLSVPHPGQQAIPPGQQHTFTHARTAR